MAKVHEKIKAFQMRRDGASIKEIAQALGIGKSTASIWLRDIQLTSVQKEKLFRKMVSAGHKGRLMGAAMNREKKLERIRRAQSEAIERISSLNQESLFYLGLGLYWGEGTKSATGALSIVNSDPRIIQTAMEWFIRCFSIPQNRFRARIFISDVHRDREKDVLRFWAKTLGLPSSQFARTVFLNRGKKVYENHKTYYGVLALTVLKGREVRYSILALIERFAELESRCSSRVRTRDS